MYGPCGLTLFLFQENVLLLHCTENSAWMNFILQRTCYFSLSTLYRVCTPYSERERLGLPNQKNLSERPEPLYPGGSPDMALWIDGIHRKRFGLSWCENRYDAGFQSPNTHTIYVSRMHEARSAALSSAIACIYLF